MDELFPRDTKDTPESEPIIEPAKELDKNEAEAISKENEAEPIIEPAKELDKNEAEAISKENEAEPAPEIKQENESALFGDFIKNRSELYNEPLIVASGLVKNYGSFTALKGIGINIAKGKIIGLLGPNGSGKTTLIKILAGLLTPTSGSILIDGHAPGIETKSIVSYLPERPYFNSWMKVSECLDYFEDFYADFDRAKAEAMLADLGVPTDKKLRTLSKGTKEKVQLVLVMSRNAKLYLLDEPIAGVDPAAREYILKTILSNYRVNSTVIVSTHLISDIEPIIDSYVFINKGNILESQDVDSLKARGIESLDSYFREVFRYV